MTTTTTCPPLPRPVGTADDELTGLLERAGAADSRALAGFYDRTNRLVYGLALRTLRLREDAEEVTLDVYLQIWRKAACYDPGRGGVEAWLVVLTRSRALDRLRCLASRTRTTDLDGTLAEVACSDPGPDATYRRLELERRTRRAVETLSPPEREAIQFAFFEGCTHVEVAERLGLPLGTVKSRIRAGLTKLRDLLRDLGGESAAMPEASAPEH